MKASCSVLGFLRTNRFTVVVDQGGRRVDGFLANLATERSCWSPVAPSCLGIPNQGALEELVSM